ncbi:hypothetical protein QEV83_11670 [Methylocapsa sp. D3K7]|uniref:hypothetical protein n=1 Tax=Methylocapsa sp. D3K7 TaxID=3041435 RepID=UPI00244ED172|nr:hypothetical protein [Methylocapsa sp. D3K7]WGJ13357.1 hypothetical protein QEV83_11670 [Methylocapsa sp. D3K7]
MTNRRFPGGDEHSPEPEILLPGRTDMREAESELRRKLFEGEQSFHRIYVTKTGSFGLLPFFVLAGVIAAIFFVFVLGAFLILLPLAGFLVAAAIVTGLLRGRSRWPR